MDTLQTPRKFQINLQLIIFVIIVFVLSVTIFFAYVNAKTSANDQKRVADITQIQAALKLYYDENGFYPANSNGVPKDIETYLNFWPVAPSANGRCTSAQNKYTYSQRPGTDYWVTFCLGTGYKDLKAGFHQASSKGIE